MEDNRASKNQRRIAGQYTSGGLCERVAALLAERGLGPGNLRAADLEGMDEFHVGGAAATRELAIVGGIQPGWQVLDIGAGVGGPARRLAGEFGCEVVAMDITEEYCRLGGLLNQWLGIQDQVAYVCADAAILPFSNRTFDAVWMQFAGMNVADKAGMAAEIGRVLRPGGRFVFQEVFAGNGKDLVYPVFWADEGSLSHLVGAPATERILEAVGFAKRRWEDVSEAALAWYDQIFREGKSATPDPTPLNVGVIVDREAGRKSRNIRANIEDGRIAIYRGVFDRV